ncbi:MAG TPA: bifunctional precorrin-2 dehydrogenase/sirohydrochlorin ferrochelatase [Candidatus Avacidaminococcus intestinavium]|uniref:precorrin-2 dehydrogenase n=1 Tax=Candidatus Avacidaminococcus intestinavium TaxID=2840684 RepID=A0A9D1MNQ4_9FIRM|nr:bifunctional precorrin-2 dehydrogenase/sirohydrochlorin ferrochelatase [Candidatus Avacidaminococcus intestinavium]
MTYYPINLVIKNKRCVVVGGGRVALRKVQSLLEAEALVTVISPMLLPQFAKIKSKITYLEKKYTQGDLEDCFIVICATNNQQVNAAAAEEARASGALVDLTDNAAEGDFTVPAKVRRGPLTLTISTDGLSPALTVLIKKELEKKYNENYTEFLLLLGELRGKLKQEVACSKHREAIWRTVLTEEVIKLAQAGKIKEVKEILEHAISSFRAQS